MIDEEKRSEKQRQKDRVRRRMRAEIDPDNYEYIPEKKPADYYDNDIEQRVAIYVRVSTDDIRQTTSYELQKKYYEDFVKNHPNWILVGIYADEGISGTSLKHRDAFNNMISDCKAGKIDLIITKSVSRFARNVMITIGLVRDLSHLKPPVGIFFESECIFSLNDDTQMTLTFLATMAEEESHTRSRSMETSLRMRLDNGIPLTPKLLGYSHDADGNLIVNEAEAPTVKLAFYMYLYGYSTQQIADAFIALGRRSYLGNIKWTSSSIVQILRNERHCGDVLTRKTFTEDFRTHRKLKNHGDRPQSHYRNHHEAIISRDDFIAVQKLLDNAKYRNKNILPELRVISEGMLKGFVTINARWSGFGAEDYLRACRSVYSDGQDSEKICENVEFNEGDYDFRGFEIARSELFDSNRNPYLKLSQGNICFSTAVVNKFGANNDVELLIHPLNRQIAVRTAAKENRNKVCISKRNDSRWQAKNIPATAFYSTILEILDLKNDSRKYRMLGSLYEESGEMVFIFSGEAAEAFINRNKIPMNRETSPSTEIKNNLFEDKSSIRAFPEQWASSFGKPYYLQRTINELETQSKNDWQLRMEGQLFETGKKIKVTDYEVMKDYIKNALSQVTITEGKDE